MRPGIPLCAASSATTVRVRGGRTLTIDGPAGNSALAGYRIVDCADLDEALEEAARLPAAASGAVEIRPLADCSELEDNNPS